MKISVLLPNIFNNTFTYISNKKLKPGDMVEVPFGKKKSLGIVWNEKNKLNETIKLKKINKKVPETRLHEKMIKFIDWFSIYNLIPRGLVLKMCLNYKYLKKEKDLDIIQKSQEKKIFKLNKPQKKALSHLTLNEKKFLVNVLQGVTGSGKTIVYFELIKNFLKNGKQILVLMPEIFLTKQFNKRFFDFFGFEPAVWHSKISPKRRRLIWNGVLNNKVKLVIGARSSLLLPFKNIGTIIVDEEHDSSYKQEEGIKYNARDMAIAKSFIEDIPITLVSSIPSLETFKNILDKKYKRTIIKTRFNEFPLPETKIVNLNIGEMKNKLIADETLETVKNYLATGNQILFFMNRRGHSPYLICKKCNFKQTCPNCSIYLTYHKKKDFLVCHYCSHTQKKEKKCNTDNKKCEFHMYGPGVEKVYEEVKKNFPKLKVKIFSSDYIADKNNKDLIEQIEKNKIDILVGTQMISKGYNFPKLNCIVVIDCDFNGKGYDLRTIEKNLQLYNQLSGRAGRFSKKSIIIYQTFSPESKTLDKVIRNEPEKFLMEELELRKKNNLPPFKSLISIIISSKKKDLSLFGATQLKSELIKLEKIEVLGPIESPIFKLKKYYRNRLLLRFDKDIKINMLLNKFLENLKISGKIKLTVDVDPINFV